MKSPGKPSSAKSKLFPSPCSLFRARGFTLSKANGQTRFTLSKKGQTGFTLIELLVVFSVLSVLSGVGIVSLVSYGRSQELSQAANDVKLFISEARFNSLSAVKTVQGDDGAKLSCGTSALSGYAVALIGSNSLDLIQRCANAPGAQVKRLTLSDNLTFSIGTNCSTVSFGALNANPSGAPCTFVIQGYEQSKVVTIDALGNVAIN